jgi:SPP1 gp7 family putative phage head morphogenesis protein
MSFTKFEKFITNNKNNILRYYFNNGSIPTSYYNEVLSYLKSQTMGLAPEDSTRLKNLQDFSSGKKRDLEQKLSVMKTKSGGNINEFIKMGENPLNLHTTYMKVEGNTVNKLSNQIQQWNKIKKDKYLEWVAVMDDKTRPEHRQLNGVVKNVKDGFWNNHFPGSAYNCRCTYKIHNKANETKAPDVEDDTKGIVVNPGKYGLYFNKNHSYL